MCGYGGSVGGAWEGSMCVCRVSVGVVCVAVGG